MPLPMSLTGRMIWTSPPVVAETCRETSGVQRLVERGCKENCGGLGRAGGMDAASLCCRVRGGQSWVLPAQTPSLSLLLQQRQHRWVECFGPASEWLSQHWKSYPYWVSCCTQKSQLLKSQIYIGKQIMSSLLLFMRSCFFPQNFSWLLGLMLN